MVTIGPEALGRSQRRRKWLTVTAGVLVLLSVAGGAAGIVAVTGNQHTGSSVPTTSATPDISALQRWWSSTRGDFMDVKDASQQVQQAFSVIRPGALAAACQRVHDAAEVRLKSRLPSPNSDLTAELKAAIEDFHSAAHMCLAVVAGSPVDYDGEFLSSMAEANRHMAAAQDIIDKALVTV
jgi:hypothetical protein